MQNRLPRPEPESSVADESARDPNFHPLLDEEVRVFALNLSKVKAAQLPNPRCDSLALIVQGGKKVTTTGSTECSTFRLYSSSLGTCQRNYHAQMN
jgi:hypothetical protein